MLGDSDHWGKFLPCRGQDAPDFDNHCQRRRGGRGDINEQAVISSAGWMFVLALGSMYLGAIDVFREGSEA